jgi:hypothetical protein
MTISARIVIRQSARFGDRPVLQVSVPGTDLWVDVSANSFERDGQRIAYLRLGAWSLRDFAAAAGPAVPAARIDTAEVV